MGAAPPSQLAGSKGRSDYTLETVEGLLADVGEDLSPAEIAEWTGMSRATAQHYLTHLHDLGRSRSDSAAAPAAGQNTATGGPQSANNTRSGSGAVVTAGPKISPDVSSPVAVVRGKGRGQIEQTVRPGSGG